MVFSKPFNEDERRFIRVKHGWMTHGEIADELNKLYSGYNEGTRTARGVQNYIAEMTGSKPEVELPRAMKDVIKDNGHDIAEVRKIAQKGVADLIKPYVEKPRRVKA
jgi:hypothetical protein